MNVASRHSGNTMVAGIPKCDDEGGTKDMAVVWHQLNYLRVENSNMSLLYTIMSGAAVIKSHETGDGMMVTAARRLRPHQLRAAAATALRGRQGPHPAPLCYGVIVCVVARFCGAPNWYTSTSRPSILT